jgi:uncharacterized FlaG/YvyC family protein
MDAMTGLGVVRPTESTEPTRTSRFGVVTEGKSGADLPRPAETADPPRNALETAQNGNVGSEDYHELAAHLEQVLATTIPEAHSVRFRWAEEHRLFVLEVYSQQTGELVKQYPPEKILNIRQHLDELLGVMIDRQV